jgi:hypothetical protein
MGPSIAVPDWNARALVEHVIGFHDVLLLRPLGAETAGHETSGRHWSVTVAACGRVPAGTLRSCGRVPGVGNVTDPDRRS